MNYPTPTRPWLRVVLVEIDEGEAGVRAVSAVAPPYVGCVMIPTDAVDERKSSENAPG